MESYLFWGMEGVAETEAITGCDLDEVYDVKAYAHVPTGLEHIRFEGVYGLVRMCGCLGAICKGRGASRTAGGSVIPVGSVSVCVVNSGIMVEAEHH